MAGDLFESVQEVKNPAYSAGLWPEFMLPS
jgi:hypothetical protein